MQDKRNQAQRDPQRLELFKIDSHLLLDSHPVARFHTAGNIIGKARRARHPQTQQALITKTHI